MRDQPNQNFVDQPGVDPDDGVTEPAEVEPPGFFARVHARAHANPVTRLLFKITVTILGLALVIVGIIMIFTPGQGILSILLGLGLLSLEYVWAQRALDRAKARAQAARDKLAAQDPAERKRRFWLAVGMFMCVSILIGAYLALNGYPNWMLHSWDRAQGLVGWVPELPDVQQ